MDNYNPNFQDPRVQKRVNRAVTWADRFLSPKRGVEISAEVLNGVFGSQNHPLSGYLRGKLLVEADSSYKVGQWSKKWMLNKVGREALLSQCEPAREALFSTSDFVVQEHGDELAALTFQYEDKAARLWHPLQNIRREQKQEFWQHFGLPHDYDIVACAPNILFQLAERQGLKRQHMTELSNYLADRSAFRQHVMDLTGLEASDAKRLVNSLFNGARLAKNRYCAAYKTLGFDPDLMDKLQNDGKVEVLRSNIARMWRWIEMGRRVDGQLGLEQVLAGEQQAAWKLGDSKSKWAVYFKHERKVLDSITSYLADKKTRMFTEHDGFRTEFEIDLGELQTHIREQTGFDLKIEKTEE
jgi:hypothetical protein